MISSGTPAEKQRKALKSNLKSCLRFVGSFTPLVTRLIKDSGFDGVYISGSVISADLGVPDIGLTTLSEVVDRAELIGSGGDLPSIVDADTGFGEVVNCARTVKKMERKGFSGMHLEDQVLPKRCGHLDHKKLISKEEMVLKIRSAVQARTDPNFLIIARTDARGVEGLEKVMERAEAYLEAGADVIFPEALASIKEFETVRNRISKPLLANMTEFGKTEIIPYATFKEMGYNIVIYPVSTFRVALKAVEEALKVLYEDQQSDLLSQMQTRDRLYELLNYEAYNQFDQKIFNFKK